MLGLMGLLNPEWEKRRRENDRRYFESRVKEAVAWDATKTKWSPYLVLDGNTYQPELLFPEEKLLDGKKPVAKEVKKGLYSPSGKWVYGNVKHHRGQAIALFQPGTRAGEVRFTTDVVIPVLWEIKPYLDPVTWMSLTPAEMMSQRNGVRRASGDVVVYGLGMGWFLAQVCGKKTVKKVTVVEKSREILDWLGPAVRKLYPQTEKVTEWVCADAYEYAAGVPAGDKSAHLFDIWDSYKEAPWDDKFQKLKTELKRVWGWGDHYVKELHG